MKQLYVRVGMSVDCTDEEYEKLHELMSYSHEKAEDFLWDLYLKNHSISGKCYLPAGIYDNPNFVDFEF